MPPAGLALPFSLCEADEMTCPLCQERRTRRRCPALGREICAVCCGTKRLVEIACPPDCRYLAAAQAHPAASVRRQQDRDLAFLMAVREGLSSAQSDLFWAVLTFVAGFHSDPLLTMVDEDVSDGAAALAATYETAGRGLIYEHRPQSLLAQRFVTDLQAFLGTLAAEADSATARTLERDAAVVLRHLEQGVRKARKPVDEGPATGLAIIGRVVSAVARDQASRGDKSRVEPPRPMLIRP